MRKSWMYLSMVLMLGMTANAKEIPLELQVNAEETQSEVQANAEETRSEVQINAEETQSEVQVNAEETRPEAQANAEEKQLELQVKGMRLLDEWQEETSDIYRWLVVDASLTNWKTEAVLLQPAVSAQLTFREEYVFDAEVLFPEERLEPLVVLDGDFVFRIPNMVAEEAAEDLDLVILVEGEAYPQEIVYTAVKTGDVYAECAGYETPEEAVSAYLEAMKNQDLPGMISTFAIKTYVEHFDPEVFLQRVRAFSIAMPPAVYANDVYTKDLFIQMRRLEIVRNLYYQYLFYSWPEEARESFGSPISFKEEEEITEFLDTIAQAGFSASFADLEFVEYLNPGDLTEYYDSETNKNLIKKQEESTGSDEMTDVAAHIRLAEQDYLLCMQCARYGDKWYNLSLSGNLGQLLGISSYTGGLMPED